MSVRAGGFGRPPGVSMMKLSLASGVFMARCDEDLVVLDTRSDQYSCLPEAAAVLTVSLDDVEGPSDVLDDLMAAGLVTAVPGAPRRALPPRPGRSLSFDHVRTSLEDEISVLGGAVAAWTRGPGRRPLAELLVSRIAGDGTVDLSVVGRLTRTFARRLPWDPAQGACLYRAWLLRSILHSRGQDAIWVFGVKTWPFGAHCWLQLDDYVLDDDPDRVAHYTPIMAV